MRRLIYPLIFMILLASCTAPTLPATPIPSPTPKPTQTPYPTSTPTETPMPTATPIPSYTLSGIVFFDYNGSGEQDFAYNAEGEEPVMEPGIPDVMFCVDFYTHKSQGDEDKFCTMSDEEGFYEIKGIEEGNHKITVESPTGDPATAFRYINIFKGSVVVPEYTKDIDAGTMASLTIVPECDISPKALVCKADEDTLLIRKQCLNDTKIKPIDQPLQVQIGPVQSNNQINIALMQGFLTLPFIQDQIPNPSIQGYFDIVGYRIFDDEGVNTYFSTQDGIKLSYDGRTYDTPYWDTNENTIGGVGDSHTGIDYLVPLVSYLISAAPTSEIWFICSGGEDCNYEKRINAWFINPDNQEQHYGNGYGHLGEILVDIHQTIYRGQIIGLSGNSGYAAPYQRPPMLHFHLEQRISQGWKYIDPYRYLPDKILPLFPNGLPNNFWGSDVSWWTKDNDPQFSLVQLSD